MVFPPVLSHVSARPGQAGIVTDGWGESRNSQCLSNVKGPVGLTHNALARTGDGQATDRKMGRRAAHTLVAHSHCLGRHAITQ